jgi:hypothetical protein
MNTEIRYTMLSSGEYGFVGTKAPKMIRETETQGVRMNKVTGTITPSMIAARRLQRSDLAMIALRKASSRAEVRATHNSHSIDHAIRVINCAKGVV